jgi:hypothetical protein
MTVLVATSEVVVTSVWCAYGKLENYSKMRAEIS